MSKQTPSELLGLTSQQLTQIAADLGEPAYRGAQLFAAIYRQGIEKLSEISTLPVAFRKNLSAKFAIGVPRIEKKFCSVDGTIRYLLALGDGETIESVWMPSGDGGEAGGELSAEIGKPENTSESEPGPEERHAKGNYRATICISSQAGCAVDCKFCMTALLGHKRNLSPGEIVGQVITVLNDRMGDFGFGKSDSHFENPPNRKLSTNPNSEIRNPKSRVNLVFMGMGEPFLNYDNFMAAVCLLVQGVGIAPSRMTVSTAGIVPRIQDFGREAIRPKLAISLSAPNDELRTRLMPLNRKWNLKALIGAARIPASAARTTDLRIRPAA